MPTRDAVNKLKPLNALTAATLTASADGNAIDLQGFDGAGFHVFAGPSGDALSAGVAVEFDIAESDDGTTWNFAGDYDVVVPEPQSATHQGIGVANGAVNTGAFFVGTSSTPFGLVAGLQPVFKASYIGRKRYVRLHVHLTGTHATGIPVFAVAVLTDPNYRPVYGNLS